MNWLQEAFLEPTMVQAVIIISLVSALGLYLGRIKIFGISLGITFVFFAGILAGHLGIVVNKDMLYFAQSFGLILFVYALGLQVGPGFFSSLKKWRGSYEHDGVRRYPARTHYDSRSALGNRSFPFQYGRFALWGRYQHACFGSRPTGFVADRSDQYQRGDGHGFGVCPLLIRSA